MVNPGKPTREETLRQIADNLARAYVREPEATPELLIEELQRLDQSLRQAADAQD